MPLLNLKRGAQSDVGVTNAQQVISGDGAIVIPDFGHKSVILTKGSAAAITLAAPTTAQNGVHISVKSTTAFAHVLTVATIGMNDLGASGDVCTFSAAKGNSLTFEAYNGDWFVESNIGVTIA
jgi:hypothetical protein